MTTKFDELLKLTQEEENARFLERFRPKANDEANEEQDAPTPKEAAPGQELFWAKDDGDKSKERDVLENEAMTSAEKSPSADDDKNLASKDPSYQQVEGLFSHLDSKANAATRLRRTLERTAAFWRAKGERRTLSDVPDQKDEKRRQTKTLLWLVLFAVAGVVVFVAVGDGVKKELPPQVKVYQSDFRLVPEDAEKESFRLQYEDKLEVLNTRLKAYEGVLETLNARMKTLDREKTNQESLPSTSVALKDLPDFTPEAESARVGDLFDGLPQAKTPSTSMPRLGVLKVYDPKTTSLRKEVSAADTPRPVRHYRADRPLAANRARHEEKNTYLPAGSFARAVVLSGVTAPTGGNAANNPVPLLLELTDLARLPNAFHADIERCFVTASATGDLSSERVWIRLDRMSCMAKNGRALDIKVQGYATGEDGKTGVRARLVTRSGQAVANAVFTGLLSGMGKAVSLSAASTVTYSSGATGTTVNDSLKAGVGEGMSEAMDRIVDYYMRLADKIFPVLELDSGRSVDVVFSQGVRVSMNETDASDTDSSNAAQTFGQSVKTHFD